MRVLFGLLGIAAGLGIGILAARQIISGDLAGAGGWELIGSVLLIVGLPVIGGFAGSALGRKLDK